jgi:hypothetical protein
MTDDLNSPLTRSCTFCDKALDPDSRYTWHKVTGWERPGRKGGSDIAARTRDGETFACDPCVRDLQAGRVPGRQESLI